MSIRFDLPAKVLAAVALVASTGVFALTCDVNNDGSIDKQDITLITQALNTPASGPGDPRDADGNGVINIIDARLCALRCTRAACAGLSANTPPVAGNDTYNTNEDTPFAVAAPGVLANDSDADGNPLTAALVTGPAQGTLLLNGNGSFNYSPPANFSGTVTFTYRANDGTANSNVATVSIVVNPSDDAPVGNPDTYSTSEDTTLSIVAPGVLGNDSDPEGDALAASLVTGPPAGSGALTLNANGSFVFIPAANFTGAASFTYRAGDGLLLSSVTTVTINVTPVDDAPVANADNYSTNEDTVLNVVAPGVLGNDTDVDGPALTAQLVAGPATGALTINADGSFTYAPAANASGPVTFTYRAFDGTLTSNPATVTITVLPVNDAPVAQNDNYTTPVNTTLNVVGPGVLGNDVDQEGSGLTAIKLSDPASGALALNANGSFTYVPVNGFSGPVSFTYKANDGTNDSNVATVSITVSPATNAPPVANADGYNTPEDTALSVPAPGVLGNDSDPNDDPLTAILVTPPANGSFALNANGSFSYTPPPNFNGPVTFTYQANDGTFNSNTATATINVTPANDPPSATNDSYATPEDTALNVAAPGVLGNDTDVDGNPLTASLVSGPANGVLVLNANGSFSYTPAANFHGPVTFTYQANDGTATSNVATVNITVTPVNDAPVAGSDSYSATANQALAIAAPGVLANDSDVEGSTLTAAKVTDPANGTVTLNANGSLTYTPNTGFSGTDSFTYRANDGNANSNIATVTITVSAAPNTPPVANADGYNTPEDTALNVAAPGVLGNDTDADGNTLTAIQVSGPAQGSLTLNANGSFSYIPPANFNGPVTFTYKANDGTADSNVATVTITVTPVNDGPVATADSYSTAEDTPLNVVAPGVLGNDTDLEGSTLTAALVSGSANGAVALNPNGSFGFTPSANFTGSTSFTYRANDGNTDSNVTTVTINVTPVDDAPVANGDNYSTNEDVALNVAAPGVLGNDTDIDNTNASLSAILVTPPASGVLVLNPNGSFSYTPAANISGPLSFTYRAFDGTLNSNIATVNITVLPVNDAPVAQTDNYSTNPNTLLTVVAPGVLGNDVDQEGNGLTAVLVSNVTNGTLNLSANGSFTYTPNNGFTGTDSFTYKANDGTADSNVVTAFMVVSGATMTLTLQAPFIAIGGVTSATVTLSQPAPPGGTLVQLSTDVPGLVTIAPTVLVPQGQTTAMFSVTGVAIGSTNINATAPGFTNASVLVTVTVNVITVGNVTVAPGAQAQFPVTLATPAPAGGLTVTLTSSNTAIATVPASVFIPAGQSFANPNPLVTGVTIGAATITGTAAGYAPGVGDVTVAIAASFNPSPLNVVAGQSAQTTLTLAQPAPAGGITVNLTTNDATRATVASPVVIPAGQVSGIVTVTGVNPGSTGLTASGLGLVTNALTVIVGSPPAITVNTALVGKNLQVSVGFGLAAPAPAGNLGVTITSADPAKVLVAQDATSTGQASIALSVGAGASNGSFYVQALDGTGTVQVTASAPGYANGSNNVTLNPSGFAINTPASFSTTTLDPNTNIQVCVFRLTPGTLTVANSQDLRFGIAPVSVSMTSSNPAVGTLVNTPRTFAGNTNCSALGAAGFQFDPVGAGSSVLAVAPPAGFSTPSTLQSITATVTASGINVNAVTVGKDLQSSANGSLQAPAPAGGVNVTLTSADPARLLLAPNATTAGTASIVVNVPQNTTSISYFVQALDGTGTVQVTASAPGYANGSGTMTLNPSGFAINTPPSFSTTTLDPNTNIQVCVFRLTPGTLTVNISQSLRFGIAPVSVSMTSSNPAVGTLVNTPRTFAGNTNCSALGAAGFQFDPVGAGSSVLAVAPPAGFSTPSTLQSITATVTASGIDVNVVTVGKDLQAPTNASLQAPAPAGGVNVTLTSADSARLLLAPNATTAGTASIVVNVPQNTTSISYVVQALDGTGTVQVTASAPGYANGSGTMTLNPSGFAINTPPSFSTTTLDPNTNIQVCVFRLTPGTLTVNISQSLRFGIAPVSVSMTSSNPAVGTLVNTPRTFAGNTNCSALGAAGFQFDPVGAGSSVLAVAPPAGFSTPSTLQSITATVTASGIDVNVVTVGKDLQAPTNASLQAPAPAGGVNVTLTSADSARLLLAPNATTAGTASIVVNVPQNTTSISYVVQALDGTGTVQVMASAPGFVNGSGTMTLTPSGFAVNTALSITTSVGAANANIGVCVFRLAPGTFNLAASQNLRFGIAPVSVSMTSSNPAVGTIVNTPRTFAGNTNCSALGAAGFQFDPVAVGSSVLAMGAVPPVGFSTPSERQTITATVNP